MDMLTEFSKGWHLGEASLHFPLSMIILFQVRIATIVLRYETTRNLYTSKESVEIHGFTRPPSPSLDNVQLAIRERGQKNIF